MQSARVDPSRAAASAHRKMRSEERDRAHRGAGEPDLRQRVAASAAFGVSLPPSPSRSHDENLSLSVSLSSVSLAPLESRFGVIKIN